MKRLVPIVLMLAATPLFAQDPPKKEKPVPPQPAVADSPLVAAAKKTPKRKATTIVITNETLSKSGSNAHITTTSKVIGGELPAPPPVVDPTANAPDPPVRLPQQAPKITPEQAKKRLEETVTRTDEDGPYGDDPARAEHQMEALAKAAKQNETKPEKP